MSNDFLRRSQVVTTFGPGALLDLPRSSVLISGLQSWSKAGRTEITEPRLVSKLCKILDVNELRLFTPPAFDDSPGAPKTQIGARVFPTWFVVQDARPSGPSGQWRRRRLLRWADLDRGKFVDPDDGGKRKTVVPVRFVVACRNGHIDDLDWSAYVHRDAPPCGGAMWVEERGTSGDIAEVYAGCACRRERPLYEALMPGTVALGMCAGKRPWLGPHAKEACGEPNRLLVRTASNAYFPQLLSVISLPEQDEGIAARVASVWDFLQIVQTVEHLALVRNAPNVAAALHGLSDEAVMSEIARRRSNTHEVDERPIKHVEFGVLNCGRDKIGVDEPDSAFYAETLPRNAWDPSGRRLLAPIDRIVLVHRLREVIAQVGFTRFDAISPDADGELDIGVKRAALSAEPSWLPAVEHRGEGVFIAFRPEVIDEWQKRAAVTARGLDLLRGFDAWKEEHQASVRQFPGLPYLLLHSLSHLLMTAISLECGYPASSLRERVYGTAGMYGILIYTGSSDAEGTLGGLVETGRRFARHLEAALRMAQLCSNDPVCSEHDPPNPHESRYLLGAACHGCLLIAETSCEQRNDFLDRALVVPTVSVPGAALFDTL